VLCASGREEREVKRRNQQQHLLCKECAPVTGRRLLLAAASRRRPLIGGEVTGVRLRLDPADPRLPFTPRRTSRACMQRVSERAPRSKCGCTPASAQRAINKPA